MLWETAQIKDICRVLEQWGVCLVLTACLFKVWLELCIVTPLSVLSLVLSILTLIYTHWIQVSLGDQLATVSEVKNGIAQTTYSR